MRSGHSLLLNRSASFKASVQRRALQSQGTHLCLSCLFEGNYCFEQRQETFKHLVLERLCVLKWWGLAGLCGREGQKNLDCCAIKLAKCVAGVWHMFALCCRCGRVSAGCWCLSTTADLQEHFWQLRLRVPRWLRDGDPPGLIEMPRCGLYLLLSRVNDVMCFQNT